MKASDCPAFMAWRQGLEWDFDNPEEQLDLFYDLVECEDFSTMGKITFGSVCSGIEAVSVAVEPLGWEAAWFAEIESFPSSVLAHHWPHVQNLGDMTTIADKVLAGELAAPDVLAGGTPCQAFSVAGLRGGLSDHRGQLTLSYVELANAIDSRRSVLGQEPCVTWWENVPGVLSSKDNAFGCFLAGLAGESEPLEPPGGKWADAGCVFGPQRAVAWRILDAQYFGLAQRRRRVFVVASARDGFDPTEVLFELEGLRRDSAPSREAGQAVAGTLASRTEAGGFPGTDEACSGYVQPVGLCVHGTQDPIVSVDRAHTLGRNNGGENVLFFRSVAQALTSSYGKQVDNSDTGLGPNVVCVTPTGGGQVQPVLQGIQVRRLTPTECERLQGFPDGHTLVPHREKPAADGPRYKALGNSMAVNCMRWIGNRINSKVFMIGSTDAN